MPHEIKAIGVVKSPYKNRKDAPKQGIGREEISTIIIYDNKLEELKDCKHLLVLYWMHLADRGVIWSKLRGRGVFATRSPDRPNPIGVSTVEVVKVEENMLQVKHLDAIDGTPVIDIKKVSS